MNELTFQNPNAFWALLALPVLLGMKIWGDVRARRAVHRIAAPRLLGDLLSGSDRARSWVSHTLELAALALFIAALARPQYGFIEEEQQGTGRSLIIGIDTSKSMLANDLEPNRLTRAKLAAEDLVKKLRGDRIGLMPFAGTAFMYAPITGDTEALLESIDSLDGDIMPRGGSNLARAIEQALHTFQKADLSGQQAFIVFTDGEENEGEALAAARKAREKNVAIICVAIGTAVRTPIPDSDSPGGYYRDRDGRVVFTRMEKDVLLKVANITEGLYVALSGPSISDSRLDLILQKLQRTAMTSKTTKKSIDRFLWPLSAGLICLTAGFLAGIVRRVRPVFATGGLQAAAAMGLASLFLLSNDSAAQEAEKKPTLREEIEREKTGESEAPPASAADELTEKFKDFASEAVRRATKQANEKQSPDDEKPVEGDPWKFYREGDYKNALYNFDRLVAEARGGKSELEATQFARGVAAFKAAEYDLSIDAFGEALATGDVTLKERTHYNLGNALYERAKSSAKLQKKLTLRYLDGLIRQMENSVEHYQETLVLNKDNAAAKTNHKRVNDFIEALRKIREAQAQREAEGKGKGQKGKGKKQKRKGQGDGESQGQGEGEGEGDGESQGQGKGKKKGDKDSGGDEEGDEENGGEGKEPGEGESDEERKAREQSNKDRKGQIGTNGEQEGGKKPGEGEEDGGDKAGGKDGEDSDDDVDDEVNNATGYSRSQAKQMLEQLSDEDYGVRPQIEKVEERRPKKDW